MNKTETTYDYSTKVRDLDIKFRKWKVKDRKKFIKLLKDIENIDENKASSVLVYGCLEKPNTILSPEEFRYVLTQIRKESIGDNIDFEFVCDECKKDYKINLKLEDIIKPIFSDYTDIIVGDISIKLDDVNTVSNKLFYDDNISNCETAEEVYLTDLLLHIKEINGNKAFTFIELMDFFDDLDTDIIDDIFDEWDKQRFTINDVHDVECSFCKNKEKYMFDDLPGFFPVKWFTR